jgi:hypothetical protein
VCAQRISDLATFPQTLLLFRVNRNRCSFWHIWRAVARLGMHQIPPRVHALRFDLGGHKQNLRRWPPLITVGAPNSSWLMVSSGVFRYALDICEGFARRCAKRVRSKQYPDVALESSQQLATCGVPHPLPVPGRAALRLSIVLILTRFDIVNLAGSWPCGKEKAHEGVRAGMPTRGCLLIGYGLEPTAEDTAEAVTMIKRNGFDALAKAAVPASAAMNDAMAVDLYHKTAAKSGWGKPSGVRVLKVPSTSKGHQLWFVMPADIEQASVRVHTETKVVAGRRTEVSLCWLRQDGTWFLYITVDGESGASTKTLSADDAQIWLISKGSLARRALEQYFPGK